MTDFADAAQRIHDDLPVVDGHNDFPWEVRTRAGSSFDSMDPSTPLPRVHTDIERLRRGGVGAQFWSVYVPCESEAPFKHTMEQIDLVEQMNARYPAAFEAATTAHDVRRIRASRRTASLMGAEGGHSIENSIDKLHTLFERGVRYMTLTHADTLDWADSATDEERHGGLTEFGRDVVREMNAMGMIVDISHVSADTMRDALDVSTLPVMASHSSAYAVSDNPRNVPDDVLRAVCGNGGVVMVNFFSLFVVPDTGDDTMKLFAATRRIRTSTSNEDDFREAMAEYTAQNPVTIGDIEIVLDHIEHIAEVAGIDHVGLGSDFDGITSLPKGLEDVSTYPNITAGLLARSWSENDIRKMLGENILRVLEANER
ncbi:MAG: dipeptidase [Acidobacteria bacterium]|nr:dipeptidase [Acidobacteriota bacterium]